MLELLVTNRLMDGTTNLEIAACANNPDTGKCFLDGQIDPMDDLKVDAAVVDGTGKIRVVVDELLKPETVEQFLCACADTTNGKMINCPGGTQASGDPSACPENPDNPGTGGKWIDNDNNGLPDQQVFVKNVGTVKCGAFTWNSTDAIAATSGAPLDGFYNPSGNQLVPVLGGLEGIGPAIVLTPPSLPTSSTCSVSIASSVTDKDGNAVPAFDTMTFKTEPLALVSSMPAMGATGVTLPLATISMTFNAGLDPASVGAAVTVQEGTTAFGGTAVIDAMDNKTINFTPTAAFTAGKTYTVTIAATLKDANGGMLPAVVTFTIAT